MPGIDAEELVDLACGRRFAEAVHADRGALESHVLAPEIRDAGFDGDARQAGRKDGVAPGRILAVEDLAVRATRSL